MVASNTNSPLLPSIVLVVVLAITSVTAVVGRLVLFTAFVVCDWTLGAATSLSWKSASRGNQRCQ